MSRPRFRHCLAPLSKPIYRTTEIARSTARPVPLGLLRNPRTQAIEAKSLTRGPLRAERARRLGAAVAARAIGRGGIIRVAEATGLSRATIRAGLPERDTAIPRDDRRPSPGR